jgi:signal transduction histidine kinase/DNA-binding response OmpR family regulator
LALQAQVKLKNQQDNYPIGKSLSYLEDPTGELTFNDILAQNTNFSISETDELNFGYTRDAIWIKCVVTNQSDFEDWLISLPSHYIDYIDFYSQEQGNWKANKTGIARPIETRRIEDVNFSFLLKLPSQAQKTYYFRFKSESPLIFPLYIQRYEAFNQYTRGKNLYYGVYFGILLVMVFYNFFIYMSLRDKNYLYYVFTIMATLAILSSLTGYSYVFILKYYPVSVYISLIYFFGGLITFTTAILSIHVLDLKKYSSPLYYLMICNAVLGILFPILEQTTSLTNLINNLVTFHIVMMIISGIVTWKKGNSLAKYYVFAWTLYALGGGVLTLRNSGVLPSSIFTEHAVELGSVIEIMIISFALSRKYKLFKQETIVANQRTIQVQKEANEELENKVQQRTLKIEDDKKIIKEQAEKLVELDKIKTRFFANISHELRTPITLIKAPIQSILKNQELSERNDFLLNTAAQNTDNLLSLVNEILDLTKLDNQKLVLIEEKVVFYTFIRQILSNFQSIAETQAIEMTLNYQTEKGLQILLDKDKFRKILTNLLSNALKFTPPNGKIVIEVRDSGAKILMKVQDNGRGIPEADVPHIFERYFQSSQNNNAEGGLGIGLALSKELIKLFEGEIWVESNTEKESQGSTFFVEFPKKEVLNMLTTKNVLDIEKDIVRQTKIAIPNQNAFLNLETKKTILLVEDNKDLRDYLVFTLATQYNTLTAENGEQALEILAKGQIPNLIISDLMMPVMDGYKFLEAVKNNEHWAGLPFIMLTARAAMQDKLKALRVGVDDYITKPFEEEELVVRIENLLTNYEERVSFIQTEHQNTDTKVPNLSISSKDQKWLVDFENLILENLRSSLFSIDYLAELLHISRTSLYKKVKTLTGLSPNQYVRVIRLKSAKDILESTNYKNIQEVAKRVGFQRTSHFTNLYKKEYGKSPSEYRS